MSRTGTEGDAVNANTIETLTPVQAIGVALSVQAETMTMGEAQMRAPDMLDHLHRMGFSVVAIDTGEPTELTPPERSIP